MACTVFDSKSPKALFNVSDSFREGKNINNRQKWQAPPIVVEAEVHENYYSEIESDSEISDDEATDEDFALNQEVEDSRKSNLYSTPSIFFVHEPKKTLNLTTVTLDFDNILVNQENDSVLKTGRSCILKGKTPAKDVESRQCKGLLGYANQFENCLLTKKHNWSVAKTNIHLSSLAYHEIVSSKHSKRHMIIVYPDITVLKKLFYL